MKKRNKEIVKNLSYSENKISKRILRSIRICSFVFCLIFMLTTITYILMAISALTYKGIILGSIIYFAISIYLVTRQKQYFNKVMDDSIKKTICPEAYLNLNLYNAKRIMCSEGLYNESLNNIAYAYIQLGELERAENIIKYLDTRKKNIVLQSKILENKVNILFFKNDINKFNEQTEELKKVISFIPKRYKKEALLNIDLKQAVMEKNIEEVNNKCDLLEKKKNTFNKLYAAYYRGLVLVKNKKQGYEEYYNFVSEHGNNLIIANEVRKKLKINDKKIKYKRKFYIGYKVMNLIIFTILLISSIFWTMYTIYIYSL